MIYVIERLWYDSMENHNSYGYTIIGYLSTEEKAKDFCTQGGKTTADEHWAFTVDMPNYRYKELNHL